MFRLSGIFAPLARFPKNVHSLLGFCKVRPSLYIFSTNQIHSPNWISDRAWSDKIFQQFSKCFAHISALLYCEYCSLVVKVSFVLFFWKLCVGFEVNLMFEFVVYIDIVEKVSTLPKYYVCLRRACTACMSLQKQD